MPKCGHPICPDTNCGWKHPFNDVKRSRCNRAQKCISTYCSGLKLFTGGAALYDICVGHCQGDEKGGTYPPNYKGTTDYACANFDNATLVDNFGANICGVDYKETKVGQLEEAANKDNSNQQKMVGAILVVVLALLAIFALTRK